MVTLDSTVRISGDLAQRKLADELVILEPKGGHYYGLNAMGAQIWDLLRIQPRRVSVLRDAVLAEYEVDIARCERDILGLLEQLAAEGLIEIVAGE